MKTFQELQEGIQDPDIFKCFFLAGGPGSGKSYVVRYSIGGTGLKVVNSDAAFETMMDKAGLTLKMNTERGERETEARDKVRGRAKVTTNKMRDNYLEGRLGVVIDGTGDDYDKINGYKAKLQALGYDCYMIFVNTSLDVALERNAKRDRNVTESVAIDSWNKVQANIGKFQQLFGRQGFVLVDNNKADDDIEMYTHKVIKKLVRNKVNNHIAKAWIADQMQLRGITKAPSARNVGGGGGQGVKGGVKLPGSAGFKTKMGRKRPKTGRYAKK
jgi:cytidylate kinase